jgi:two-component system, sensor histidine kinase and response regulator
MNPISSYLIEMFEGLKNYPIRLKLVVISLSVAVATLLLASVAFTLFQISAYRETVLQNAVSLAKLVASDSKSAFLAGDAAGAAYEIQDFTSIEPVQAIALFDAQGKFFAGVGDYEAIASEGAQAANAAYTYHYLDYALHVQAPIVDGAQIVGSVHVKSSLLPLQKQISAFTLVLLLVVLGAIFISYSLIAVLQRIISDPILTFKRSVDEVRLHKNFDVKVPITTRDELGELATGFNEMLQEIKRRDERLAQGRVSLEKSVQARTLDIQNAYKALESALRDITEEKVKAEQANKAKSEFLAMMSHEIRTPMNGILGMTSLLASSELTEEQQHYARTAHESGEVLLSLINHVLDYSRLEAGKMSLELVEFDLVDLVSRTCALFSSQMQSKGLQFVLETKMETALNLVVGDMDKIRQVLINLISNAIKFTDQGAIAVSVALIDEQQCGAEVQQQFHIAVADTGVGIEAVKLNSIFDVFTQEDSSTTRLRGGSGLGLSISKRMLDIMGGAISVQSRKGAGSTFGFTLSLTCRTKLDSENPQLMQALNVKPPVVVAAENSGSLVRQFLLPTKVPVQRYDAARSIDDNVQQATANAPLPSVLILSLDGQLAEQLNFALALRHHYQSPELPIIIVLDDFSLNAMVRERLGSACYCLAAPVHKDELFNTLNQLLLPANNQPAKAQLQGTPLGMKVLLVEDNKVNQQVAQVMIAKAGCQVTTVENGKLALEAFIRGGFDLIYMDCHMPVMDGYESTIHIRNYERKNNLPATPIVALTANVYRGDREKAFNIGMTDYLLKPFKYEQIYQMLAKHHGGGMADKVEKTTTSQGAPLLELGILQELKELSAPGEESVLAQIVSLYVSDSPKMVQEILAALALKDLSQLTNSVHALKGMSAGVGGAGFAELCLQIELACKSNNLPALGNLADQIVLRHQELCVALNRYVEQVS